MNVIPALVAGVDRIVLASPPGKTVNCRRECWLLLRSLASQRFTNGRCPSDCRIGLRNGNDYPVDKLRDPEIFTSPWLNGKYSARLISI
ncbi:histidinol dehydrogenase [Bacillus licheniformis]|nr:histidinol dehydrogenase [Bacillus licheniformis]